MTIYPYEVSVGLMACTGALTFIANILSMRCGHMVAALGYALVAASGIVCCAFAALFGYWVIAGVGAAAVAIGVLLALAIANTIDTERAGAERSDRTDVTA